MSRRLAGRLALGLGSLLASLFLLEAIWRLWWTRGRGPTTNPRYVVHDDLLGWRYRPGASARHRTAEFDVQIRIDAEGFREGGPRAVEAPAALYAFGDSFTFGWGVEAEEAFPARLGQILGRPVANRGVSGYGPDQEYLLLDRILPAGATALVLHCANDVEEATTEEMYGKGKPRFRLEGDAFVLENVPVPFPAIARLSLFYRSLAGALRSRRVGPMTEARVGEGRALVRRLVAAMAGRASARGGQLVLLTEGAEWLAPPEDAPGWLRLDLAGVLARGEREEGPVRFARDGHWNARGHLLAARAIAVFLREEGLVR